MGFSQTRFPLLSPSWFLTKCLCALSIAVFLKRVVNAEVSSWNQFSMSWNETCLVNKVQISVSLKQGFIELVHPTPLTIENDAVSGLSRQKIGNVIKEQTLCILSLLDVYFPNYLTEQLYNPQLLENKDICIPLWTSSLSKQEYIFTPNKYCPQ